MISSFSSNAAKILVTDSIFPPEVFHNLTAEKIESCLVVKFKKSPYFSNGILT